MSSLEEAGAEDQYQLVYEGLDDESPKSLQKLKGVFIADLDLSISEVQEILASVPAIIRRANEEKDLLPACEALKKVGARVHVVQPKGMVSLAPDASENPLAHFAADAMHVGSSDHAEAIENVEKIVEAITSKVASTKESENLSFEFTLDDVAAESPKAVQKPKKVKAYTLDMTGSEDPEIQNILADSGLETKTEKVAPQDGVTLPNHNESMFAIAPAKADIEMTAVPVEAEHPAVFDQPIIPNELTLKNPTHGEVPSPIAAHEMDQPILDAVVTLDLQISDAPTLETKPEAAAEVKSEDPQNPAPDSNQAASDALARLLTLDDGAVDLPAPVETKAPEPTPVITQAADVHKADDFSMSLSLDDPEAPAAASEKTEAHTSTPAAPPAEDFSLQFESLPEEETKAAAASEAHKPEQTAPSALVAKLDPATTQEAPKVPPLAQTRKKAAVAEKVANEGAAEDKEQPGNDGQVEVIEEEDLEEDYTPSKRSLPLEYIVPILLGTIILGIGNWIYFSSQNSEIRDDDIKKIITPDVAEMARALDAPIMVESAPQPAPFYDPDRIVQFTLDETREGINQRLTFKVFEKTIISGSMSFSFPRGPLPTPDYTLNVQPDPGWLFKVDLETKEIRPKIDGSGETLVPARAYIEYKGIKTRVVAESRVSTRFSQKGDTLMGRVEVWVGLGEAGADALPSNLEHLKDGTWKFKVMVPFRAISATALQPASPLPSK